MSDPFSILSRGPQQLQPKYDPTKKVSRYRRGEGLQDSGDEFQQHKSLKADKAESQIEIAEIALPAYATLQPDNYETTSESEESEEERVVMFKPVFRRPEDRVTEAEKAARAQEEAQEAMELARLEGIRKTESRRLCEEALKTEEAEHLEGMDEVDDLDDDDPGQYAAWKVREIKRLVREREERIARDKERQEIERRRNLTDWEREEENKALGTDETAKPVQRQHVFMQKYYTKGSFFQERDAEGKLDPLFMRDYNAPVSGDFDKSILPSSMQKRRGEWGMKGQTKYTHLTAEDTTDFDPLYRPLEQVFLKQQLKLGGYKAVNSFDSHFKSKKP
mmetsp:Transcript_22612/g.40701  ORF Transcript_22612/g.40701 Transcript_22612/m.40701 type:complete len:334 (-) Transcript_22612:47-1048(-)